MPGYIDPEVRKQICSKGGKTAQARGNCHRFTPEEAREAGRKGGTSLSQNRAHMQEIGRRGGLAPRKKKAKPENPADVLNTTP